MGEYQQLDIFCRQLVVCGRKHAYVDIRVVTDQVPSVADFSVAVSSVSTQGRRTPTLTYILSPSIILYHCDYTGREKPKTFFKDI